MKTEDRVSSLHQKLKRIAPSVPFNVEGEHVVARYQVIMFLDGSLDMASDTFIRNAVGEKLMQLLNAMNRELGASLAELAD